MSWQSKQRDLPSWKKQVLLRIRTPCREPSARWAEGPACSVCLLRDYQDTLPGKKQSWDVLCGEPAGCPPENEWTLNLTSLFRPCEFWFSPWRHDGPVTLQQNQVSFCLISLPWTPKDNPPILESSLPGPSGPRPGSPPCTCPPAAVSGPVSQAPLRPTAWSFCPLPCWDRTHVPQNCSGSPYRLEETSPLNTPISPTTFPTQTLSHTVTGSITAWRLQRVNKTIVWLLTLSATYTVRESHAILA